MAGSHRVSRTLQHFKLQTFRVSVSWLSEILGARAGTKVPWDDVLLGLEAHGRALLPKVLGRLTPNHMKVKLAAGSERLETSIYIYI